MKQKLIHISLFLLVAVLLVGVVSFAGSLTPPGSPSKTMKSLSDLYELINTGSNTPANNFTTPGTVSSTMNTIGDIYDLMTTKIAAIDTTKILTGTSIFGKAGSAVAGYVYPSAPLKTDQTICYDNSGSVIACTDGGTALGGQDGYYQEGIARSYTDNLDGTVTDNNTGLMWKKCSQGKTGVTCATGSETNETWTQALADCEADTTGGYIDWRLPNIMELLSIFDPGRTSLPLINPVFNVPSDSFYLSSTTDPIPGNGNYVWYLGFNEYGMNTINKGFAGKVARCVRSI